MSRIYFHTKDLGRVDVRGSERAYFNHLAFSLSKGLLGVSEWWARESFFNILFQSIDSKHYLQSMRSELLAKKLGSQNAFAQALETAISINGVDFFGVNAFDLKVNTALALGCDAIKLAARITGQCELHCFVQSHNKEWLANIIKQGRKSKIFRSEQGWENVIDLLSNPKSGHIVLSYSVCNGFYPEEDEWDKDFEELKQSGGGLELCPETFQDFYFEDGWTFIDLANFYRLYVESDIKEELLALNTGQKLRFTRDHS